MIPFFKSFVGLFILLCSFYNKIEAQVLLDTTCNQSTTTISITIPANSFTNIPGSTPNWGNYYLCGPNTQMYDTLANTNSCRNVFLNSGCKLITKSTGCFAYEVIFAKNSSTVVIRPGAGPNTRIIHEPLAVIINQAGLTQIYACSSLTFPIVSCGITNIDENKRKANQVEVFPNPTNNELEIQFNNNDHGFNFAKIVNSNGLIVKEIAIKNNYTVNVNDLPNGVYFLRLFNNSENEMLFKRFIVCK